MDAGVFLAWMSRAAGLVEEHRDRLTELDAAIGDGDHGINVSRGFAAVLGALEGVALSPPLPGQVLTLAGRTLISKVGGASGPLYGTAFRRAGQALGNAADVDLPALAAALEAGLEGVRQLGGAAEGDKTMVDVLAPATRAFSEAVAAGASPGEAFGALTAAARTGAASTIPMTAHKGRASYLGPRSAGHEDPGAASSALILTALADAALAAR